jgi:hypothetical protein
MNKFLSTSFSSCNSNHNFETGEIERSMRSSVDINFLMESCAKPPSLVNWLWTNDTGIHTCRIEDRVLEKGGFYLKRAI